MTRNLDMGRRSEGDRTRGRAYQRDFWPGMVGYAVVLAAVLTWGGLDGDSPLRYVWAVLPVVPALWIVRALLRHLARSDEYERLLALKSLAVGFSVAMVASLTVGFLGVAGLAFTGAGWIVYSAGMLAWAVSGAVFRAR